MWTANLSIIGQRHLYFFCLFVFLCALLGRWLLIIFFFSFFPDSCDMMSTSALVCFAYSLFVLFESNGSCCEVAPLVVIWPLPQANTRTPLLHHCIIFPKTNCSCPGRVGYDLLVRVCLSISLISLKWSMLRCQTLMLPPCLNNHRSSPQRGDAHRLCCPFVWLHFWTSCYKLC